MRVNQKVYTRKYFLEDCEGYETWKKSKGSKLSPRMAHAWKLSGLGEVASSVGRVKVLDFGCGRGEMVVAAMGVGAEVVGVDYSKEAVSLSKEAITAKSNVRKAKSGKAKIILLKSKNLPFGDKSFDLIFFLDVAEHLYPGELLAILGELKRVLKPGGRLIIHTAPNKKWLDIGYPYFTRYANLFFSKLIREPFFGNKLPFGREVRSTWDRQVHVNEQTEESLRQCLEMANFGHIKVWLGSSFRISDWGAWFQFMFLQPIKLPIFGKYFQMDIWGVALG